MVVLASAGRQVIAPKDTCCTIFPSGQRPQLHATAVLQAAKTLLHANMVYQVFMTVRAGALHLLRACQGLPEQQ